MKVEIHAYNDRYTALNKETCTLLATTINSKLPESQSKTRHAPLVWFMDGNPIVGSSKQKAGWRLMFLSREIKYDRVKI